MPSTRFTPGIAVEALTCRCRIACPAADTALPAVLVNCTHILPRGLPSAQWPLQAVADPCQQAQGCSISLTQACREADGLLWISSRQAAPPYDPPPGVLPGPGQAKEGVVEVQVSVPFGLACAVCPMLGYTPAACMPGQRVQHLVLSLQGSCRRMEADALC